MKISLVPLLLFGLLLGGASAVVTAYLLLGAGSSDSRAAESPMPDAPRAGRDSGLLEAIDDLLAENMQLRRRIEVLENTPEPIVRDPVDGYVSQQTFEAFQKEVRGALAQQSDATVEPEEFKGQIAGALIDIRRQEACDKVRPYQETREARREEDLEKMADWLELSPHQVEGVRGVLLTQYDREQEQRRLWEEGGDEEVLGELKRTDGEAFDADLRGILTDEQRETFWEGILGGGK